tara:strand:+ start:64 stop:270 length:207 start_codon:yes stop_codon:yes gene_type:complete
MSNHNLLLFSIIFFIALPAHAYIGPGMAGGVIAAIFGFIAAIFLALFGILHYPIKRAIQNRKKRKNKG